MINKFFFILIILFSHTILASTPTSFVTIQKKEGILLRQSTSKTASKAIGAVHYLYSYPVIDTKLTYVKIQLPNNKQGWVYVGGEKKHVSITHNQLTSIAPYDIAVKSNISPYNAITTIKPKQKATILDKWYGRLKLKTPDNLEGWIFNGPYHDPWTSNLHHENNLTHFTADFT